MFKGVQNTVTMMANNIDFKELAMYPDYEPYAKVVLKDVKESNQDLTAVYFGTVTKRLITFLEEKLADGFEHYIKTLVSKGNE